MYPISESIFQTHDFRLIGLLYFLAIWRLLLMDCTERRHNGKSGSIVSGRMWHGWSCFPPFKWFCIYVSVLKVIFCLYFDIWKSRYRSSWGPEGILQLTLIVCILQSILYATMWKVSRKSRRQGEEQEMTSTNGQGKPLQK